MTLVTAHHFWLSFTVAGVATVCAVLTIALIYRLTKKQTSRWNGYLFAIFSMSICQLLYDSSFFLIIDQSQSQSYTISFWRSSAFLNTFGNVSSLLWTNCLSFTVLYVAINQKSIDFLNYKYIVISITTIPALILAILQLLSGYSFTNTSTEQSNKLLLIIQWALVFINLMLSSASAYFVYRISKESKLAIQSGTFNHTTQARARAIELLSRRMRLYPLFQILSRALLVWYEFYCGCSSVAEDLVVGNWSTTLSPQAAFVLYELIAPCSSIGYFVIFLVVQPHARSELRSMFGCKSKSEDETDRLQKLFSLDQNVQPVYPPLAAGNTKSVRLANGQYLSDESSRSAESTTNISPWDMIDIDDLANLDDRSLARAIDRKTPNHKTSITSSAGTSPFLSYFSTGKFFQNRQSTSSTDTNSNADKSKSNDDTTFAIRESGYSFY